jgi:hypothetical protein
MYARVVTVQAQPGKSDEAIAIFRDSVIPSAAFQTNIRPAFASGEIGSCRDRITWFHGATRSLSAAALAPLTSFRHLPKQLPGLALGAIEAICE